MYPSAACPLDMPHDTVFRSAFIVESVQIEDIRQVAEEVCYPYDQRWDRTGRAADMA